MNPDFGSSEDDMEIDETLYEEDEEMYLEILVKWMKTQFKIEKGSNNDVHVLLKSLLFKNLKHGIALHCNFTINGHDYTQGYYLVDENYPEWSTLVQDYKYFNGQQMKLRKDVECAFGILKRKFSIIAGLSRFFDHQEMNKIILTCIILHNVVIEETRSHDPTWTSFSDEDLRPRLVAMFSAGIETSRATMVAAISLLVKNPKALTKLRDEIDFHVEESRFISESDLPKLSYLQCRDLEWWDEPTKFKPERFDSESAIKEGKMVGFWWIPFGAGRRGCPGSGMEFRVTSLAIGGLIQCLEWKKVGDSDKTIEGEGDEHSSRDTQDG
ncbi:isoflavone 2'-hydroxylase-like [Papaver somniferum]|uniref:isoflavone 2'-hydroxylase-like n=1 Tax=Papaver somniferum TaxID=3469 RepID=UPI000E6FE02E|nr:isoflavone 2'-hydroxylase-like [Papaver somniferum]